MSVERKHIIEIGIINPIVHNVLQHWSQGDYTFEEAMMDAVTMLEIQNRNLTEVMEGYIKNK
ncbi:MAG: hypothetical protein ACTSWQ_03180 [Candidatus Thorarchaeota archaeon]